MVNTCKMCCCHCSPGEPYVFETPRNSATTYGTRFGDAQQQPTAGAGNSPLHTASPNVNSSSSTAPMEMHSSSAAGRGGMYNSSTADSPVQLDVQVRVGWCCSLCYRAFHVMVATQVMN